MRARASLATASVLVTGLAIAVVGSQRGSPFTPPLPSGTDAGWPLRGSLRLFDGMSRGGLAVLGAIAIFAAAAAFLYALGRAWRGELSVRRVVVVALVLHVMALAMPVFLSRDVYSYGFYGRIVSAHGGNPYTDIPAAFSGDPAYPFVSVDWIDSPSVYGPAFSAVAAGVTALAPSAEGSAGSFKLLAALAGALSMLLAVAGARRVRPERAAFAAALVGWNPVVVFHGVAGGHNDALLGLAVAAGALAILRGRGLWGTAVLSTGTLVKVSGGVALLLAMAGAARDRVDRLRSLAVHVGVALAVSAPFAIPFIQAEDPTLGTLELAGRQGWLAPSRFVLTSLRGLARAIGGDIAADVVSLVVRISFPALFVWVLVMLIRHLWRRPARITAPHVVAAIAWAGLISLLVSPVLLPWYAAWIVPLAWVLPRIARGGAVLLSLALAITELVAEPSRSPGVYEAMVFGLHWVATPVMLLVLVRLILDLRRRVAAGPREGLDDPLLAEDVEDPTSAPGAEAEDQPGAGDGEYQGQRAAAPGEEPHAVAGDRRQDRHRGPERG